MVVKAVANFFRGRAIKLVSIIPFLEYCVFVFSFKCLQVLFSVVLVIGKY